jgi:hypothetical protein
LTADPATAPIAAASVGIELKGWNVSQSTIVIEQLIAAPSSVAPK